MMKLDLILFYIVLVFCFLVVLGGFAYKHKLCTDVKCVFRAPPDAARGMAPDILRGGR